MKKSVIVKKESYNPSPYLRKVIEESEKELAEGKIKFSKGIKSLIKSLKS